MKSLMLLLISLCAGASLSSCALKEPERRPVGPQSSESYQAWNAPRAGEGQGQFGMLQQQ